MGIDLSPPVFWAISFVLYEVSICVKSLPSLGNSSFVSIGLCCPCLIGMINVVFLLYFIVIFLFAHNEGIFFFGPNPLKEFSC